MEVKAMKYPVVIHKDQHSDYGILFPDLPGCFSAGSSSEEAMTMAAEAAECHIEGLLIDAEEIPAASSIEEHRSKPEYADGIWALIDVDISKLSLMKSKQVKVTLPERLLNALDRFAKNHGESRSDVLVQAAVEYMAMNR